MTNLESFEKNGFLISSDVLSASELGDIDQELNDLGRLIVGEEFSVADFKKYNLSDADKSLLYDRLKYIPALSRLSGSKNVLNFCKSLGIQHPSLMGSCNMRLDKPHDAKHLFEWHQDSVYLLGSHNAVTVWIPLQDVNLIQGTIEVIPGSHNFGIYPFEKISDKIIAPYVPMLQRDIRLAHPVKEKPLAIEAKRGDVVIFRQMLLHRSTPNLSDQIRWTVQLRITDLSDPHHRQQGYPTGDKRNIFFVDYKNHNAKERLQQELQK